MALDDATVRTIADAYTAAWNSGSPEAVSEFYAEDGRIVINRGSPWEGRRGVAQMAAGFFADVPDLTLVCDGVRVAGNHVAYLWTFTGTHASSGRTLRVSGWEEWDLDADNTVKASLGWLTLTTTAAKRRVTLRTLTERASTSRDEPYYVLERSWSRLPDESHVEGGLAEQLLS